MRLWVVSDGAVQVSMVSSSSALGAAWPWLSGQSFTRLTSDGGLFWVTSGHCSAMGAWEQPSCGH